MPNDIPVACNLGAFTPDQRRGVADLTGAPAVKAFLTAEFGMA